MLQRSYRPRTTTPRRSSATQNHSAFPFTAPNLGVDISQPLPGGNPFTAIRLENLIPRVLGCQMRRGYTRWMSNMVSEIRTLMGYIPAVGDPQLFAANSDGDVFDVTNTQPTSYTPTPVMSSIGLINGEWTSLNYTSDAGIHYLVMVGPDLGYWTWDGTTWVEHTMGAGPGQIDGVNPRDFAHVMVFKGRLVFIEEDTTRAWYLDVGVIAGVATPFDFGPMLPHGGKLEMLINWTYDGGGGVSGASLDNKLVIIASQGDVLVYGGNDPNDANDFQVQGRWYVGRVPPGRRFAAGYGADVAILSERGLCFMSELMRGQGFFGNPDTARKINSELAAQVKQRIDARYWEVVFLPEQQLIIINIPDFTREFVQWAYEVNQKAFCTLRSIPMLTAYSFNGKSWCGDYDGNVWWTFEGQADAIVDGVAGPDLRGVCVTSFQPLGEGVRTKRFLMVRPSFTSDTAPGIQVKLNSEWNMGTGPGAPPYLAAGENLWDQGHWDFAVWSGVARAYEAWIGVTGSGRYGSLAMSVRGSADTVFVGWQALVEQGGIL